MRNSRGKFPDPSLSHLLIRPKNVTTSLPYLCSMVTQFVPTNTRSALDVLATERERTTAEQEAFAEFHDRITAMDVSQEQSASGCDQQPSIQPALQSQPDNQLQHVREAYYETVMSLPHYDDEYHDSLSESLAGEFHPEIASALITGSQFTSLLRTQLIEEGQQAQTDRADFLKVLSQEADNLNSMDERITTIGTDLDTLTADSLETWPPAELAESREQLLATEERCEELATARQSTLQTPRIPGPTPTALDLTLNEYLYQSLPVTYPVLADLADMADTLHTERSRVDCVLERTENSTLSNHLPHP
jgi:two-component sensor histidine kinase